MATLSLPRHLRYANTLSERSYHPYFCPHRGRNRIILRDRRGWYEQRFIFGGRYLLRLPPGRRINDGFTAVCKIVPDMSSCSGSLQRKEGPNGPYWVWRHEVGILFGSIEISAALFWKDPDVCAIVYLPGSGFTEPCLFLVGN
jgi:hypothetical protein